MFGGTVISGALSGYWWLMAALAGAVAYGFGRWRATPKGRIKWDRFVLRLPIFGP